jgi:peptidyl-prolyl cis-trans isomerase C
MTSASCTVKPVIAAQPKSVSVNGVQIARDAIAREAQNHPAAKPIDAWRAAARALVVRELLIQEASRLAIAAEPLRDEDGRRETDDEARMRALVAQEIVTPEPDEAACRRYYEQNQRRFRSQDLCEVSHILLPGAANEAGWKDAEETARTLLAVLAADPAAFPALARRHSVCPSREVGGSLGQIGPGQTVPEFETALGQLQVGRVHPEPIVSRYGLHIVRLDRRIEGRQLPFAIAQPLIASYLAEHVQRMAQRQYVTLLAGRARIEGVALDAAASPLMQ